MQRLISPYIQRFRRLEPALLLVMLLGFILNIVGIWWGVMDGSTEDWAADSILPVHVFSAAAQGFQNGWHERYPPFHYQLLTVLYAPFLALHVLGVVDVESFPLYTGLLYLDRFLTLGMATVAVILVYECARELEIEVRGAVFAAAIASFNVLFVFYAKTTNLDMPYTMWFLASFLFLIRALKTDRQADYVCFAILATLAICTKDQAYALYILLVPVIAYARFWYARNQVADRIRAGVLTIRRLLVPTLAAALLFAAIYVIPLNLGGFIAHVELITGPASKDYRMFENSFSGHMQMLVQTFRQLIFALGWPLFAVCCFGVVHTLRRAASNVLLLLPLVSLVSYYAFFVSMIGYNEDRFFLPICALLALVGGKWLADILAHRHMRRWLISPAIIAVFAYSWVYAASIDAMLIVDSRYEAHRWMEDHVDDDALVAAVGRTYYLPPLNAYRIHRFDRNPSVARLRQIDPDYIVTSSIFGKDIFREGTEGYTFFTHLLSGNLGYELVFQHQGQPMFNLVNRDGIYTNLDKINPRIQIFGKARQQVALSN